MRQLEKRYSDIIYIVKALAIACTIAAHMPSEGMVGKLLDIFGTMGVPTFLFISGLFWEKGSISTWKKYIDKIAIPWILGGTINWIICYLRHYNSLTLVEFLLGKGSYLWYLSVSVGILLIWSVFPQKGIIILYILSILRIINVHFNWIPFINTNLYLSILYWNFWFSSGFLLKKSKKTINSAIAFITNYRYLGFIIWILLLGLYIQSSSVNYFTWIAIPFGFASIWVLFILASYLRTNHLLVDIGKNTLTIYIWHILVAGFVAGRLTNLYILHLFLPIMTLLLIYFIFKFTCLLLNKLNMSCLANRFLGWRY